MTPNAYLEPPPGLVQGIEEFNRQEYFECHETLEELWMAEDQPIRQLYQGILQIGVGFYHLRALRYRPAMTLFGRGSGYLTRFAPACMGVEITKLLDDVAHCRDEVQTLGPENLSEFDWSLAPKIEIAYGE